MAAAVASALLPHLVLVLFVFSNLAAAITFPASEGPALAPAPALRWQSPSPIFLYPASSPSPISLRHRLFPPSAAPLRLSPLSPTRNLKAPAADVRSAAEGKGSSGGRRKAGIAVGAVAGAALLGVGLLVYKKRQDNIRRSTTSTSSRYQSYPNTTRRDFL